MIASERERLVQDFIAARTMVWDGDMVLRKKETSNRAESALYDAVWAQPEVAWELMCEISRATADYDVLQAVANGPLHELLVKHPPIIDRIEKDAAASPQLRFLLSHLWAEADSPIGPFLPRIRKASGEFDEPPAA